MKTVRKSVKKALISLVVLGALGAAGMAMAGAAGKPGGPEAHRNGPHSGPAPEMRMMQRPCCACMFQARGLRGKRFGEGFDGGFDAGERRGATGWNVPGGRGMGQHGWNGPMKPHGNGRRGFGQGARKGRGMRYAPNMPDEVRARVTEMRKLRVDLQDTISRTPIDRAKAMELHGKIAKLGQEIRAWRFEQRLDRLEAERARRRQNRDIPDGAPAGADINLDKPNKPNE